MNNLDLDDTMPSEMWILTPDSTIKVKELAEILASLQIGIPPEFYENLPDNLKKHFEWRKPNL